MLHDSQRFSLSIRLTRLGRLLLAGLVATMIGCSSGGNKEQAAKPGTDKPAAGTNQDGGKSTPKQTNPDPPQPKKVDPADQWKKLADQAEQLLAADPQGDTLPDEATLDQAQQQIDDLQKVYTPPHKPDAQQEKQLADLKAKLAGLRKARVDRQRAADLSEAEKLLAVGKLAAAVKKLSDVQSSSPTDKDREAIRAMNAEIEKRRRARRDLKFWVQLLETDKRADVQTAQNNLLKQPDIALGMMLEATEEVDKPILAANALEVLRLLNRPETTLPAMVDVLRRSDQQLVWPAAVRAIARTARPGAGEPLLKLALQAETADQRIAALSALSQVIDPPPQTLVELLPLLDREPGAELTALLQTAYRAMSVHNQYDLASQRGIDGPLTDEQNAQLAALPARLEAIAKSPADNAGAAESVQAARVLAYATRQLAVQPLTGVKVHRAEAEEADAPAAAVLDGVWNKVEPNTMWRHTINKPSTITLDLGQTRTVVGVRIWNFNQTSSAQRGWKEVDIFVSDSPAEPTPVAHGIVPPAPGAADTPDYGSTIGVPFKRGRYVRLQADSLWTRDGFTGLSEIQILGF